MPPKKSTTKTSDIVVPVKLSRGGLKKGKTVLKLPSIVKVKISTKKNTDPATVDTVKDVKVQDVKVEKVARTVNRLAKPNKKDQIITLANEVAQVNLAKKPKLDKNVPILNENKIIRKNSIKTRKRSIKNETSNDNEGIEVDIQTPQKRIYRKTKNLVNSAETESCVTTSEDPVLEAEFNVSPAKKIIVKVPKPRKNKKVEEKMASTEQKDTDKTQKLVPQLQKPKTMTKKKLSLNRKTSVTRMGPRSKRKINNVNTNNRLKAATNEKALSVNTNVKNKTHEKVGAEISKADESNQIDFRRNSMTSLSELSWTKEISSCSTTTCVTVSSNDLIRIGNKWPVIKLTNIKSSINNGQIQKTPNLFLTDKTVIEDDSLEKDNISLTPTSLSSLKLSSVSSELSSPKKNSLNRNETGGKSNKIKKMLDKLSSNLNKIDLEVVSWIGYTNECSSNVECLKSKLLKDNILREEREALVQFSKIQLLLLKYQETDSLKPVDDEIRPAAVVNRVLSDPSNNRRSTDMSSGPNDVPKKPNDSSNELNDVTTEPIGNHLNDSFHQLNIVEQPDDKINQSADQVKQRIDQIKPRNDQFKQPDHQFKKSSEKVTKDTGQPSDRIEHNNDTEQNIIQKTSVDKETLKGCDNFRPSFNKFAEDNDDDDALSLFAESITGMESSRRNSTLPCSSESQELEEYIPQYVSSDPFKVPAPTVYQPSKIRRLDQEELNNKMAPSVCEKQNADSTSINKEFESDNISPGKVLMYEDKVGDFSIANKSGSVNISAPNPPCLMASIFKPTHGVKSSVFKRVCFFNMISSCKRMCCNFPHVYPEIEDVRNRLKNLKDEALIEEYMLMRVWPKLRRQYGLCYVQECTKRDIPRILVEMSIDFIIKANSNSSEDSVLQLAVTEYTLLYLNNVDLNICADLLNYNVNPAKKIKLCDFYTTTIAETPNFSRFKTVFIKLIQFMCDNGKRFSLEVASHFLERISILPYEELLAWALIEIIKRTDMSILSNAMTKVFEKQLSTSNPTLHLELSSIKQQATLSSHVLANQRLVSPQMSHDIDQSNSIISHTEQDIRYSPDTTNYDNLTKSAKEPKYIRTINLNKVQLHINNPSTSTSTEYYEDRSRVSNVSFNNWKGKSILSRARFVSREGARAMRPPPPPPPRPPFKRRMDQNAPYGGSPAKYERSGPRFF